MEAHRNFRSCTEPFVNFGVTVGKRDAASAAMIRGWDVTPINVHTLGAVQEESVIDRIGMLIDRHENLGRLVNGGKLQPLTVCRKEWVHSLGPGICGRLTIGTKKCVHAEAPGATGIAF